MSSGTDFNAFSNGLMGGLSGTTGIMNLADSKKKTTDQQKPAKGSDGLWGLLSSVIGGQLGDPNADTTNIEQAASPVVSGLIGGLLK